MKGQVIQMHLERKLAAILTDKREYSIAQLQDGVEEGDILKWEGNYPVGKAPIYNLSKHKACIASFLSHRVPAIQLRQQLLL